MILVKYAFKLVRTHLNVLLLRHFISNVLTIYAPITSDECHAWFHLNAVSPAGRNTEQVNITKKIVYSFSIVMNEEIKCPSNASYHVYLYDL